jgi:hypothetical protein
MIPGEVATSKIIIIPSELAIFSTAALKFRHDWFKKFL